MIKSEWDLTGGGVETVIQRAGRQNSSNAAKHAIYVLVACQYNLPKMCALDCVDMNTLIWTLNP